MATSQQDSGLAYLSYYAGGLRVIDVGSGLYILKYTPAPDHPL